MYRVTRDTDYAVNALCYLARRPQGVVAVPELVRELKIPRPFLRKILQTLQREGVVHSYKGQGGGFRLARSPSRICLTDLIRTFQEGPVRGVQCLRKGKPCPERARCALRRRLREIEEEAMGRLKAITVASLLEDG